MNEPVFTHYFSLWFFVPLVLSYLMGAVPYGLVLAKTFCGIDPRNAGSGNTGATNVARLCGKKWGFFTLLCDVGKGVFAVGLGIFAISMADTPPLYTPLFCGLFVVVGHMFPVFLGFKGGKGVATTVGVFFALAFFPFLLSVGLCLLVIWRTGFVSAGSLCLAFSLPPVLFFAGMPAEAVLALATGTLITVAHKENIRRLLKGEEKPWNTKKNT